ncbi:hypothetical protein N7450_003413 [Penicillium hetheringtonii]|uniref:RNA 3'-terminal phosphate cyclase domain-containing protein n=1 Tax=Penicillium hetheringtonii TaxID=911720 RepID=A0AAD6DXS0_9EURO|nr:hypothetical protein N7450_003413 [Penicillium hetheringtonii]
MAVHRTKSAKPRRMVRSDEVLNENSPLELDTIQIDKLDLASSSMAAPACNSSSGGAVAAVAPPHRSPRHITLDGRTLEGGGQLVRIALALAALTGQPVTINHVRGNRQGKTGLKASHAAAVKLLGEISGSHLSLSLLWVGSRPGIDKIRINITGGTNGTNSPSFDYAVQVMLPNFKKLGFPAANVILHKRGWSTGKVDMGSVSFILNALSSSDTPYFPPIDILDFDRGKITRVDITILAPDDHLLGTETSAEQQTIRQYCEKQVHRTLKKALGQADPSLFDQSQLESPDEGGRIPITLAKSEATSHPARFYILLVADTREGFKIGHDALGTAQVPQRPKQPGRSKHKKTKKGAKQEMTTLEHIDEFIQGCVEGLVNEIVGLGAGAGVSNDQTSDFKAKKRSPLDQHMRDQIVVFEALGKLSVERATNRAETPEDERYWTLHTKTAQWVCREMLEGRP